MGNTTLIGYSLRKKKTLRSIKAKKTTIQHPLELCKTERDKDCSSSSGHFMLESIFRDHIEMSNLQQK